MRRRPELDLPEAALLFENCLARGAARRPGRESALGC